jgi:ribosomal protein L17
MLSSPKRTLLKKLFDEIAPKYADKSGGCTCALRALAPAAAMLRRWP